MARKRVAKLGPNSIFSDEQKLKELIELYNNGVKWGEIEEKLGVSHGTCYNALRLVSCSFKRQM